MASDRPRLLAILAIALLGGCSDEPSDPRGAMADGRAASDGGERARVLGPFLAEHWRLPIPAQGEPPASFEPLEASLDPEACGACHPRQLAEWRTSLHAGAFSPGFAGQLVDGVLGAPAEIRQCQTCHAPLTEQLPYDAEGAPNPLYDPALRARGLVCATCHVRAHRRFGPTRRPELPPRAAVLPHGGFEERAEFGESRFCAPCHQFFDAEGVNGKPIENTLAEWRESPQAAAGRTCQSCHMPDRAHTWRGIHDPETVRAAVDVEFVPQSLAGEGVSAALVLRNRDVGHRFPSYVTPRIFLAVWQEDAAGDEIAGSRLESTLGREIDFREREERFDTRVAPGESATLDYRRPRAAGAAALVGRVTVDPDHHYRGVFASLVERLKDPEAQRRIAEAHRRATVSSYVLAEQRLPLAAAPPR